MYIHVYMHVSYISQFLETNVIRFWYQEEQKFKGEFYELLLRRLELAL